MLSSDAYGAQAQSAGQVFGESTARSLELLLSRHLDAAALETELVVDAGGKSAKQSARRSQSGMVIAKGLGAQVDGESVRADSPGDMDADGCKLSTPRPDACPGVPGRRKAIRRKAMRSGSSAGSRIASQQFTLRRRTSWTPMHRNREPRRLPQFPQWHRRLPALSQSRPQRSPTHR